MKYLSPVKHLYRVAYADPTEHIKRVQNLKVAPLVEGETEASKDSDQKREQINKKKKS
jgi:hypothetical protein